MGKYAGKRWVNAPALSMASIAIGYADGKMMRMGIPILINLMNVSDTSCL